MQGWIKDYRKELESDIWMMPPLYHRVWQYLKYDANHADRTVPTRTGEKLTIKKGQTITSYQKIANDVKWYEWGVEKVPNKKTIKAILDWLVSQEMITKCSNGKGTVITICNYCDYQGTDKEESNAKETQKKRSLDTNKNDKNVKKIYIDQFEELWQLYPNKKGKATAKKKAVKLLEEISFTELKRAVERYAKETESKDKQYIKHGSTFFTSGYVDYLDDNYQSETDLSALPPTVRRFYEGRMAR